MSTPWGAFEVPVGTAGRWQIGPLTLVIARHPHEWRVSHDEAEDPLEDTTDIEVPYAAPATTGRGKNLRFGVSDPSCTIELVPVLADRAVVAQPESPFAVPPGQASVVYVSSPLWVRIVYGKDHGMLTEIPTYRPSDTWFGPTTIGGELAYAVTTFCRTNAEDLPRRPNRATTRITIENRSPEPLDFSQVSLPAPRLKLYRDPVSDTFWTEDVGLLRDKGTDFASLRLTSKVPASVPKAELVSPARQEPEVNAVVRAFSSWFDPFGRGSS